MNHRFTLDVPHFQKLLEAAWVLQRDRERDRDRDLSESQNGVSVLAFPSDRDELNGALPLTLPGTVLEPATAVAEAHAPQICEIADPSVVPSPLTVAPIYQRAEVAGALAMAADRHFSPLCDPIPFPAPDVFKKATRGKNETAVVQTSRPVVLSLPRFRDKYKDKEHALSTRTASMFKRASRLMTANGGPVVVLLIMLAFLHSLLGSHRPSLTAVKAAPLVPKIAVDDSTPRDHVGQAQSPLATGSKNPRTDLPVLEPSHLRVTDTAASLVEGLSRYEMHTLRRQAQYGDDVAALTLGMAFEIGHHVPQSCTQAAQWVAVAAEEGNSAAEYNLALRYVSGDGTPTNLDEARKWFEKAAGHGYQKARLTLQASGL